MLFNSYEFLFGLLPVTLCGFLVLAGQLGPRFGCAWLLLASLFFYGWWNPVYLLLLGGSVLVNYLIGARLKARPSRALLALGVTLNLGAIGYFKYAHFLAENLARFTGIHIGIGPIVLPLAISFFTFQQIAYLVDAYRGQVAPHDRITYALFVTFFPQLIAGPIVHHTETVSQFQDRRTFRFQPENFATGLAIFVLGLFKKVALADGIARYATPVFDAALAGQHPTLLEAWGGAFAYSFQLYFDFSGYSDMAIGLGLMFNIRLPLNFNSPYKAVNIIDFWRRWHMTLSRFLAHYLYIPLGGNRRGPLRRHLNLMLTMLLGGLWHGAGWTFVLWGGLHGLFLVVNHAWRGLRRSLGHDLDRSTFIGRVAGRTLTFTLVVVAWVFFRAESFGAAWRILIGMSGLSGIVLPERWHLLFGPLLPLVLELGWRFETMPGFLFGGVEHVLFLAFLASIAFLLPNSQEWTGYVQPAVRPSSVGASAGSSRPGSGAVAMLRFRPTFAYGSLVGLAFGWVLLGLFAETPSEFLYFQF